MRRRSRRRTLAFWRLDRRRRSAAGWPDSRLPIYSPLGIAPPLTRGKRRAPWMMIGAVLALGTAVGIAFSR